MAARLTVRQPHTREVEQRAAARPPARGRAGTRSRPSTSIRSPRAQTTVTVPRRFPVCPTTGPALGVEPGQPEAVPRLAAGPHPPAEIAREQPREEAVEVGRRRHGRARRPRRPRRPSVGVAVAARSRRRPGTRARARAGSRRSPSRARTSCRRARSARTRAGAAASRAAAPAAASSTRPSAR